jgi:alpha-glucosidase
MRWRDSEPGVLDFERDSASNRGFRCVVNLTGHEIDVPAGEPLVASAALEGMRLPPDAAVWLRTVD